MPTLRPFTQEELADLQHRGFDTSSYQGESVQFPDIPTALSSSTALGTGLRAAGASAIPTAAGGAGFAGGMALGGLLAPETGGLSLAIPLLTGLLGGYAGSKVAGKAEEAVMPDAWKQRLAEDAAAHPLARTVGSLATLPLGGLNPNPSGVMRAAGAIPKLLGGVGGRMVLGDAEKLALQNVGAGAALGGVQEAVTAPMEGRDLSLKDILLSAALGGTFNKPNAIGRTLGFHTPTDRVVDNPALLEGALRQPQAATEQQQESLARYAKPPIFEPQRQIELATGIQKRIGKSAEASAKAMYEAQQKNEPIVSRESEEISNTIDKQIANIEKSRAKEAVIPPAKTELEIPIEKPKIVVPPEERVTTPLQEETQASLEARNIPARPTPEYTQAVSDEVIRNHNIKVSENGALTDRQGNPVKGVALLPNKMREIVINPEKASIDTIAHEGNHYFRADLEAAAQQGDARAGALLKQWDAAQANGLEAFNKQLVAKGRAPIDAHEFAVSEQGYEFLKQQLNLSGETPIKKWWNDTKSLLSARWNKNATVEDLRRAINLRFVNEKTRGVVGEEGPLGKTSSTGNIPLVPRNQPQEEGDYEKYNDIQNKMRGLSPNHPDFFDLWAKSEAIKNKNGGKVPAATAPIVPRNQPENEGINLNKLTGKINDQLNEKVNLDMMTGEEDVKLANQMDKLHWQMRDKKDHSRNQPVDEGIDTSKKAFIRPLEAAFDKVDRHNTTVAEGLRRWQARRDEYLGLRNVARNDLEGFNREDVNAVMAAHRDAYRNDKEVTNLSPEQQKISTILSNYFGKIADIRTESGMKINERAPGKNKYYIPDQLNDKALDLFTNRPTSPEALYAEKEWAKHVADTSEGRIPIDQALKDINDYIRALRGGDQNYLSVKFGAIREAAGYGLPESLRETDANRAITKYGRRAANDLAMFKELESKPEVAGPLRLIDPSTGKRTESGQDISSTPEVQGAMKWVTGNLGNRAASAPIQTAVTRLVNNMLLGAPTGLRDTATIPLNAIPYLNRFEDLGAFFKGIANIRQNSRAALETAARQPSIDKLQFGELNDAPNRAASFISWAATQMRKIQGREAIENFNRNVTFSIGKELAYSNILGAKAGNQKSKLFLNKFSTLVDIDPLTATGPALEKVVNQMAKNFTDRNQGSYGGTGLPTGIVDSQFAPFFALQKWSLEKSNVIYKDVYKPFIDGSNRLPMLTYSLGTLLTGAGIQELNKLMTGRKASDPDVKEALSKGDPKAIASELATLMQLGSYAGIVGDIVKAGSDAILHGKTPRNVVSFPTATAALDLQEKTTDMLEAIRLGEDPWNMLKKYTMDLISHNIQTARMVANRTMKGEDIERSDKFRDVRVYNELEGKKSSDIPTSNTYLGMNERRFKQTGDIGEAVNLLPGLVDRAISKGGDNPMEVKRELAGLKANSYQTFPDMKKDPLSSVKYYDYLTRTQGIEEADKRMQQYLEQSLLNRMKGQMIPSI